MTDYSELVDYLIWYANHVAPASVNAPHSKFLEAATAIETLTRELAEVRAELQAIVANWEIEQSIWQTDIDRIKRTLGGQSDVMDYVKSLRVELTDTKARLAEAVVLLKDAVETNNLPYLYQWKHNAKAFLAKQEASQD